MIELSLNMKIESVANKRMHWAVKARLTKAHRQKVFNALQSEFVAPSVCSHVDGGEKSLKRVLRALDGSVHGDGSMDSVVRVNEWCFGSGVEHLEGLTIVLTRIAPRKLDTDNLASGFKAVRDGIAEWLGIDDGDSRLDWQYRQRNGGVKVYRVEVEII
jgi:hypothetical protein